MKRIQLTKESWIGEGVSIIKKNSDYVCKSKGGEGVLREIADLIISCQKLN